jgi:glycosyltransferase involved in cell wall biosynthesis
MSATVIIPTIGGPDLAKAIESVLAQTHKTTCYVVCDGKEHFTQVANQVMWNKWDRLVNFKFCCLPINVGAGGFYGHRIYAAFTHLLNTDYVLYLDQDCWLEPDHVQKCVDTIEKNDLHWTYSLRKIVDKDGKYICNDDCESLGKWISYVGSNHIDTNCYCIKTDVAKMVASAWHGGWGQDRVFLNTLASNFGNFKCTGEYSVNYRLGGNEGSVTPEFFTKGNELMSKHYNGVFPWLNKI